MPALDEQTADIIIAMLLATHWLLMRWVRIYCDTLDKEEREDNEQNP